MPPVPGAVDDEPSTGSVLWTTGTDGGRRLAPYGPLGVAGTRNAPGPVESGRTPGVEGVTDW